MNNLYFSLGQAAQRRVRFECGQVRHRAAVVPALVVGATDLSITGWRDGFRRVIFSFGNNRNPGYFTTRRRSTLQGAK